MAMQRSDDEQTSGLLINIHPQLRRRIILEAAKAHLSVTDYVERILEQNVPPEPAYLQDQHRGLNKAAIEDLHQFQEHLKQKYPGRIFGDAAEELHQIREERMRELERNE